LKADTNGVVTVAGARLAYAMFEDIMRQVTNNASQIPWGVRRKMQASFKDMHDKIYLALISEVYFARSIDIMIERKKGWGASAAARPIAAAELQQLKDMGLLAVHSRTNAISTTTTTNVSGPSTNIVVGTQAELIDVSEGDTAYDLARKLRGMNLSTSASDIGGSVRVLSVSTSSVGLRRTFERPICVGVRGLILRINLENPQDLEHKGRRDWLLVETPEFQ
jgi:hypothetical protein